MQVNVQPKAMPQGDAAANATASTSALTRIARNKPTTKTHNPTMNATRPEIVSISQPPISLPTIPPIANALIVQAASEAPRPAPRAWRIQWATKKKSGYWQLIPATAINQNAIVRYASAGVH